MKPFAQEHLDKVLARWSTRDPELAQELRSRTAGLLADQDRVVALHAQWLRMSEATELVDQNGSATADGQRLLETVVNPTARPVAVIRNNRVTDTFVGPQSDVWRARIASAGSVLNGAIPSIGRIEVDNNPSFSWLGTGWVVDTDLIVTNRHIAREFARRGDTGFVFRTGLRGVSMGSSIDFLEEYDVASTQTVLVDAVVWIAGADEPDVAFLRLKRDSRTPSPPPLALSDEAKPDMFVATIGYPARDSRIPDQALVTRIFGDVYEKKRLAPGQLTAVNADEVEHDCSTLGGNSGSPVIDLSSGAVVGLHYSGIYGRTNFAVSSSRVRQLLQASQSTKSSAEAGLSKVPPAAMPTGSSVPAAAVSSMSVNNEYTSRFLIPLEVSVRVGGAPIATVSPSRSASEPLESSDALELAKRELQNHPDVLSIRYGYRFKNGWITNERVIVVEVRRKLTIPELRDAGKNIIRNQFLGLGVDVRTPDIGTQLERLGIGGEDLEGRFGPGAYVDPPDLSLERVNEKMSALFHVSPDQGFPNLEKFIGRVKRSMTATMYEWNADYITNAIVAAIRPGARTLMMVTQKKTAAGGTEAAIEDVAAQLKNKFSHEWASVGSGGLIAQAYHIKVASRDGEEFWLSSGNWKSSGQPDIDPVGDHTKSITPLRKNDRDWHVIIENKKLATLFQKNASNTTSERRNGFR